MNWILVSLFSLIPNPLDYDRRVTSDIQLGDFNFYILGLKGSFRGDSLVNQLREIGADPIIIWGVDGREIVFELTPNQEMKSLFLYGRNLISTEHACMAGHRKMHEVAHRKNDRISVFFEDDAEILDVQHLINILNEIKNCSKKRGFWNLSSPDHNLLNPFLPILSNRFIARTYLLPTLATAYVVKADGLHEMEKLYKKIGFLGYLADVPPYYGDRLKFYSVVKPVLRGDGVNSIIGHRLTYNPADSNTIKSLLKNLSVFSGISWFLKGSRTTGIRGYLLLFHGRKIDHLRSKVESTKRRT